MLCEPEAKGWLTFPGHLAFEGLLSGLSGEVLRVPRLYPSNYGVYFVKCCRIIFKHLCRYNNL